MKLTKRPTFGADPEFYLGKGDLITCPDTICPTPKTTMSVGKFGGFNRDGMALELNPSPSESIREVAQNLTELLSVAGSMAMQFGWEISKSLAANVNRALNSTLPQDVFQIGCDPDYNAYTGRVNKVTVDPKLYLDRFAGGHIHIGVGEIEFDEVCELVKLFDYHAGLLSVMYSDPKVALERRKTYGRAGDFRFDAAKGIIEYRTPDAGWLWVENGFTALCEKMSDALVEFRAGIRMGDSKNIITAINSCNQNMCADLLGDPFTDGEIA